MLQVMEPLLLDHMGLATYAGLMISVFKAGVFKRLMAWVIEKASVNAPLPPFHAVALDWIKTDATLKSIKYGFLKLVKTHPGVTLGLGFTACLTATGALYYYYNKRTPNRFVTDINYQSLSQKLIEQKGQMIAGCLYQMSYSFNELSSAIMSGLFYEKSASIKPILEEYKKSKPN
jgi:hypothetical protein